MFIKLIMYERRQYLLFIKSMNNRLKGLFITACDRGEYSLFKEGSLHMSLSISIIFLNKYVWFFQYKMAGHVPYQESTA